jgi:hypothetical protein
MPIYCLVALHQFWDWFFIVRLRQYIIRNSNGPEFLELFLVASVSAILVIRGFLKATGYPQVGGDGLHIAHMLWGGLFMMLAMVLLFSLLGPSVQRLAAILGGVGFGTFIDELGKFITSDNNYFFQPTIGIIYIIFISVFLVLRAFRGRRRLTSQEALANALNRLEGSVQGQIGAETQREVLGLLDEVGPGPSWVNDLKTHVGDIEPTALTEGSFYFRIKDRLLTRYRRLVQTKWFPRILLGFLALEAVLQLLVIAALFLERYSVEGSGSFSYIRTAQVVSSTVAALMIYIGLWRWHRSRVSAYNWFTRAILVNIFVTQIFVFFESELLGINGLLSNILLYLALRYLAVAEGALVMPDVTRIAPEREPIATT